MSQSTAGNPALAFVEAINQHDVPRLQALMAPGFRLVDSLGAVLEDPDLAAGWHHYFQMVPDYEVVVEAVLTQDPLVVLFGTAGGTYSPDGTLEPRRRWTTPIAIRATLAGPRLAEWRIYADNEPLRAQMRQPSN